MVINGYRLLEAAPIRAMLSKKVKTNGVSHGLGEVGYDIRLKQDVTFSRDKRGERFVDMIDETGRFHQEGRFAIASAMEEFTMPLWLTGIVHDKSTWAREGLSVFNTVIEPGWEGYLTLELVYHGAGRLTLPAGVGIAQVIFHELEEDACYKGKYQNQENRPVHSIRS